MAEIVRGQTLPPNLQDLAPFSTLVRNNSFGKPKIIEKIDTPVDEYGIPRRIELMRRVVGTVMKVDGKAFEWQGFNDVHHVAWPHSAFDAVVDGEDEIGTAYKECASLKAWIPRQLHDYIHQVTNKPPIPSNEVMRQYVLEFSQAEHLARILSYNAQETPAWGYRSPEEIAFMEQMLFLQELETIKEPHLGIMPSPEWLSTLTLDDARRVLHCIANVQGFTNDRSSKVKFFKLAA